MTLPRRRGLTDQAADAAVDSACRMLRLPSSRKEFPDIATGTDSYRLAGTRARAEEPAEAG